VIWKILKHRTIQNASYILNATSSESEDDTYIVSDER